MNSMDADLQIDEVFEKALRGDEKAINLLIEPIGNDDGVTKAFIELIALARVDELESPSSKHYSADVSRVRNDFRIQAFRKLTVLVDQYYEEVLSNV